MSPKAIIDEAIVTDLRRRRLSWTYISSSLGITTRTLRRWVDSSGFVEPLQTVSESQLDELVITNSSTNPGRIGERSTIGFLRTTSTKFSRQDVRNSLHRTDADGIKFRSIKRIKRREYSVAGPHHLWHIDGHHKLIRYGIVCHGCIDGFSRTVIYLTSSDNNKACTHLESFLLGTIAYQVPSRVRGDHGGENVLIADWMLANVGANRHSFLTGSSKHNTRIERLWKDYQDQVVSFYCNLFRYFETSYGMLIENKRHIYTLQYMFLPRINEHNAMFARSWNEHPISTEHNKSPNRLIFDHQHQVPPPTVIDPIEYATLHYEPADYVNDVPLVNVETIICPLNDVNLVTFKANNAVLTMNDANETLLDKYVRALSQMNELFEMQ